MESKVDRISDSTRFCATKRKRSSTIVILVYVDGMLITGNDLAHIEETKQNLHKTFQIKDLGELKYFLVIEFSISNKGILMNRRKYTLESISDMRLSTSKPLWTPKDDDLLEDKEKYQRLIGNYST